MKNVDDGDNNNNNNNNNLLHFAQIVDRQQLQTYTAEKLWFFQVHNCMNLA